MSVQEVTEVRMSISPVQPESRPTTAHAPTATLPQTRTQLTLAATTGVLLWMCYFPVAWGWLAWFALVPLLALIRSPARPRVIYLSAFVGGLVFYGLVLQWLRVADPMMYFTWIGLAVYCACYFPMTVFFVRYLERRTSLPLVVTLPIVWTALEFFRSQFATGFSWYLLGYTQLDLLPIIQIADLAGVYAVTFLVVAVNAVLLEACWGRASFRRLLGRENEPSRQSRLAVALQALVVLLAVTGTIAYGVLRMQQSAFTPGPRVALIQGNIPQQLKNQAAAAEQVYLHYVALTAPAAIYHPDLIVWPETSYPMEFEDVAAGFDRDRLSSEWKSALARSRELTEDVNQRWPTNVLLGLNSTILQTDGTERRFNSALLIDRGGKVAGRYDKIHRVPFGEYVPLRESLPFMNRLSPYDFEYGVAEGSGPVQFPLTKRDASTPYSFGVVICYEDSVPDVARPYGGGGTHPTDMLLNISNDGWFDGTAEHEEHLAICRFRAVECRRPVARAVNMGVSAVIDGNGRVLRPTAIPSSKLPAKILAGSHVWEIPADPARQEALPPSEWGEYKKVPGTLLATIPLDNRYSFYARYGDWLPWSCWSLLATGLLFARFRRNPV